MLVVTCSWPVRSLLSDCQLVILSDCYCTYSYELSVFIFLQVTGGIEILSQQTEDIVRPEIELTFPF